MPGTPNGMPYSQVVSGVLFTLLESSITDMAKAGKISEAQVDSFNLPVYTASPEEMAAAVERNGCFSIERMELTDLTSKHEGPFDFQVLTMHLRAGFEGIFAKHFGSYEVMDELFDHVYKKTSEFSQKLEAGYRGKTQLSVILKRQ